MALINFQSSPTLVKNGHDHGKSLFCFKTTLDTGLYTSLCFALTKAFKTLS